MSLLVPYRLDRRGRSLGPVGGGWTPEPGVEGEVLVDEGKQLEEEKQFHPAEVKDHLPSPHSSTTSAPGVDLPSWGPGPLVKSRTGGDCEC